jgi:hypothetical protein
LLRNIEQLYDSNTCRICRGRFDPEEVRVEHLDYHRELFEIYRTQRLELDRRVQRQEEALGIHLLAEMSVPRKWGSPSAEQFLRHAERFGPAGVKDMAAAMGVKLTLKRRPTEMKRRRRTTEDLRRQVLDLDARGVMPTAVADALHISDRRVKKILAAEKMAA